MAMQDPNEIKEKIMSALRSKGPSLPVHVAGEIKSSILISSAFLAELVSEKMVKISNMKVGSSPLYFLAGQDSSLENFSQYLRSKEKEAFMLLKEKKFLRDSVQNPAIRVALREIRDFAIPFKSEGEIVWRYFLVPETEFKFAKAVEEKPLEIKAEKLVPVVAKIETQKPLDIFGKEGPETKPKKIKAYRKKKSRDKENEFFSSIKAFLSANSIDLLDVKSFGKKEITLKVKDKEGEKILVAYNKKKIRDGDILKAHKKISNLGLPYIILGLSEPAKKTSELLKAVKNLSSIHGLK